MAFIWLSPSWMTCWCPGLRSSLIISVTCCWICGNITLQLCFLKSFAFACWQENKKSYIPSLMYRLYFYKSLGQPTGVDVHSSFHTYEQKFFLLQWCLTMVAVFDFSSYSSEYSLSSILVPSESKNRCSSSDSSNSQLIHWAHKKDVLYFSQQLEFSQDDCYCQNNSIKRTWTLSFLSII